MRSDANWTAIYIKEENYHLPRRYPFIKKLVERMQKYKKRDRVEIVDPPHGALDWEVVGYSW